MLNLNQNMFNPNTFWDAWKTSQNINQTMFNFFELISSKHNLENNTETLIKELAKECVAYFSEHAAIANKLFMGLAVIKSPEDLIKLQHKILGECNEAHLNRTNKILNIYHELLQHHYKKNQNNFSYNCTTKSENLAKNSCSHYSNESSHVTPPNHPHCDCNSPMHNSPTKDCNQKEQSKHYNDNKCSAKKSNSSNKNSCNNNFYDKNNHHDK